MENKIISAETMISGATKKIEFAEKLEVQLQSAIEKGEAIKMDKQIIYTEAKAGVIDDYDIRADKFDRALNKIEKTQQAIQTKMQEAIEGEAKESSETPKE